MRLRNYLEEEGEGGGTTGGVGGTGGEGSANTGGTTSKDIAPFYNRIMAQPARRIDKGFRKKKKKKKPDTGEYLIDDNMLQDLVDVIEYRRINESMIPDAVFNNIKSAATKVGFKVKRSDSIFDYLRDAGEEIQELFSLLSLYIVADKDTKPQLTKDIRISLNKINRRKLTAFLLMLDKMAFGLTSLIRHILMYVFGIEITTYNKWESDIRYVLDHLDKVKNVLMRMGPTEDEIRAFDKLYAIIIKTKEEIEKAKGDK